MALGLDEKVFGVFGDAGQSEAVDPRDRFIRQRRSSHAFSERIAAFVRCPESLYV